MIDIFGHIGYAFLLFGTLAISRKNKLGWLFRVIGESIWIVLGFFLGLTSIYVWGIIFLCIDAYGFNQWRKYEAL
jgi:hypothetical protein